MPYNNNILCSIIYLATFIKTYKKKKEVTTNKQIYVAESGTALYILFILLTPTAFVTSCKRSVKWLCHKLRFIVVVVVVIRLAGNIAFVFMV